MGESERYATESTRSYLYADANGRNEHLAEIHAIAEKVGRPVSEVTECYEETYGHMRATAAVTNFLVVLASKKVREHYRILTR